MELSQEIQSRIDEWTKVPYSQECIDEIESLVDQEDVKELHERFGAELNFGTGGLRGLIRNGTNGMNIFVVAKATQGLANYVIKSKGEGAKAAVACDSRRYSMEFAKMTAQVLASNGIKTYIFKEMRPTPELSFAVRHFGCTTGIVITASHNPKEYNGYKVYWDDGAQIINPHDKLIIEEVRNIGKLDDVKQKDFSELEKEGLIEWIGEEIDNAYIEEILKLNINTDEISKSDMKIVFTPLHGTGGTVIPDALNRLGLKNIIYVEEQMKADSNFSTVKKPNPEEKEALAMAIDLAENENADLVIATDPDADRVGIAVKTKSGEFQVLSGNHIGSIIEYYMLNEMKERNALPENAAVVKTIVTTQLQDAIGKSFGATVFNVITGFKYIGQKIRNFENDNNYTYVFGGEESYGYLTGIHARDKDAVASTLMIAECAAILRNRNMSMADYLDEIFNKFGHYNDKTVSIEIPGLTGRKVMDMIMDNYRKDPKKEIAGVGVDKAIDYNNDTVYDTEGSNYTLPPANVIQYHLSDGSSVTIRPSGTEPKIKFYFSSKGSSGDDVESKLFSLESAVIPEVKEFIDKQNA